MGTASEALSLAAQLCRHFEGFAANPYICPAGYWTQGYGTVWRPDGRKVLPDDPPISRELAEEWLQHELRTNYMVGVLKASPGLVTNPQALAAMTDFAYNLGTARYRASTLRKKVDARDWESAKRELARWVFGGGKKLPGLVRRRAAEAALLG